MCASGELEENGFQLEYVTPFMAATLPLISLRPVLTRLFGAENEKASQRTKSELQVVPILNELLLIAARPGILCHCQHAANFPLEVP